ncbi:MAG TPA: hypothetical protein DCL54_07800, partial [Alphaproteobacteria bacterium]|nr:hypothetical protein [Alphaproteobacteria bacterium]
MSDYNTHYAQGRVAAQGAAQVDAGLRAYMLGIYNYMGLALLLTGVVAYGVGSYAEANPAVAQTLFGSPLKWVIIFAPLAVVMGLSFGINRLSASTAQLLFWLYAGLVGLSLSAIFLVYTNESIARTFFITAAAFG